MLSIGQVVQVTNGYGVDIGIKTIIGIDSAGRYYLTPTDTPWFSWHESALKVVAPNKACPRQRKTACKHCGSPID